MCRGDDRVVDPPLVTTEARGTVRGAETETLSTEPRLFSRPAELGIEVERRARRDSALSSEHQRLDQRAVDPRGLEPPTSWLPATPASTVC